MTTPMPLRVKVARAILGGDTHYPDGAVIMDSHRVEALASADRAIAAMQEDSAARGWMPDRDDGFRIAVARRDADEISYLLVSGKRATRSMLEDARNHIRRLLAIVDRASAAHEAETLPPPPAPPSAPTIAPEEGNGNG